MNMKANIVTVAGIILSSFLILHPAFGQGALTPPGAPAPTMKSLAQIEPRTPISSAPYIITNPGSYYLTTNVTVNFGNGITISANDVSLDLNGFTIFSTQYPAQSTYGIFLNAVTNVTIANGFIRGGVTNNGSGVYGGSGFGTGIAPNNIVPNNTHVYGISVFGCLYRGITGCTVVESCTVQTVGGDGIDATSVVKDSSAVDCGGDGIDGEEVFNSRGYSAGTGNGLFSTVAENCYGYAAGSGYGLLATSTLNCYGISLESSTGLRATVAQNCYGVCEGNFGPGLSAYIAQDCYGLCNSVNPNGVGLYAYGSAIGCYGYCADGGIGLTAYTAAYCVGDCLGGTAISVTVGNGCVGRAGTNYVIYKYNMP